MLGDFFKIVYMFKLSVAHVVKLVKKLSFLVYKAFSALFIIASPRGFNKDFF